MEFKEIMDILAGILTPITALFAIYIAIKQYRIEKNQYNLAQFNTKSDLYFRRLPIYKTVMEYIATVLTYGGIKNENLIKLLRETAERHFLFDKDVQNYIDELYSNGVKLRTFESLLQGSQTTRNAKTDDLWDKKSELIEWFTKQFKVTDEKFGKYLLMVE